MFITKVVAVCLYVYVCMCTVHNFGCLCLFWRF